jgi:endonuclease YncB( thermonuclease family)
MTSARRRSNSIAIVTLQRGRAVAIVANAGRLLLCCAPALLGCLSGGAAWAAPKQAPQILDGATLVLQDKTFRLQGIVAPDLDQTCQRVGRPYPCGQAARAQLWELVGGREVSCTPAEGAARPQPALCKAGDSDLGAAMVESGWALADKAAGEAYLPLQQAAEQAGRGLWSGAFALPGTSHPPAEGAAASE